MPVPELARALHPTQGNHLEKAGHGALADAMQEEGYGGSNIVVQHAKQIGDPRMNWTRGYGSHYVLPTYYDRAHPAAIPEAPAAGSPHETPVQPNGAPHVYTRSPAVDESRDLMAGDRWRIPPVVVHHTIPHPDGNATHFIAEANPDNVEHLAHDLDPVTAHLLRQRVAMAYPGVKASGEPFRLARPVEEKARGETIDAKGNTVGVNQWTGEPNAPKKNRVLAEVVPEHHWSDGITHLGVHPGTNNVAPSSNAAWYERSAVHKALEGIDPSRPWGQNDVTDHVVAVQKLLSSELGRKALGPDAEAYEAGTKVLPQVVGKPSGSLIGSGRDARPTGPVIDRLTQIVSPLVKQANRVVSAYNRLHGGPVSKPLDFDPHAEKKPAYEVVAPGDENIPEDLPIDLPTPSSALRKIKVVSDEKASAVREKAEKESKKNTIAAAKANKDPDAIPVVDSAKPIGWKPPEEHRFAAIHRLLTSGATPEQIKAHLTDVNGHALTKRQAAASLTNFLRAEKARRAQAAEQSAAGPVKLAREEPKMTALPKETAHVLGDINPKDLSGTAHKETLRPEGALNSDRDKVKRYTIDPQIAGTSLAYHLRQIARDFGAGSEWSSRYRQDLPDHDPDREARVRSLAEAALAGQPLKGTNGDVFAALGKELSHYRHPHAGAYNWDRIGNGLARDKHVETEVGKILKENALEKYGGRHDLLWDHIHRVAKGGSERGKQILEHLRSTVGTGGKTYMFKPSDLSDEALLDSIHRIADRHLDREYLKQVSADRKRGPSHKEGDPLYWRSVLEANQGKKRNDDFYQARKYLRY